MLPPRVNIVDVRRSLLKVKPRKAAGPDNIPGRVLKDKLSEVLTDIFNISLFQAKVPSCFKSATIIPVPKTSTVSCLNDFRPVALTPILMKCFESWCFGHGPNKIIHKHGFSYHCYADDTQLYLSFHPDDLTIAARISACLADISSWMKDHHLQGSRFVYSSHTQLYRI